jgi:hypothetical protein
LIWLVVVIFDALLVAEGFEAAFGFDILFLSFRIVGVGEDMLDIRFIVGIISVYICKDVKTELT